MVIFDKLENLKPVNTWRPCITFYVIFSSYHACFYMISYQSSDLESVSLLVN